MATTEQEIAAPYVLQFIAGKHQGREFPLERERELIIGRLADAGLALVLADDAVSSRHARIRTFGGEVAIEDLGSHAGTFVNGQSVTIATLKVGDEIRIGSSVIKLARNQNEGTGQLMSGSLQVIPLPDLLQLLANANKSGVLHLRSDQGAGSVRLRDGKLCHATIEGSTVARPRKALYRMLRWQTGTFDLAPPDTGAVGEEITETTVALMLEGMLQVDELARLEKELPPPTAGLVAVSPLPGQIKDLSAEELTIFQLVLHHKGLQAVLNHYPGTDHEACTHLLSLLRRGYVAAATTASSISSGTASEG